MINLPQHYELAMQVSEKTGFPAEWIYAQWQHETDNFTSYVYTYLNNFSGLKQFRDNNCDLDTRSPEGDNYQYFDSAESYAEYFAFYLGLYRENGIFEATTIEQYAQALYDGGYYGGGYEDPVQNYVNGLNFWISQIPECLYSSNMVKTEATTGGDPNNA